MGRFFQGLERGITEPQLQARRAIQNLALQQLFNPELDPAVRSQFAALLEDTPYADLARIQLPEDPTRALQREFGPQLAALQAAGTLFPGMDEESAAAAAARIEELTGFRFPRAEVPGAVTQPAVPAMRLPAGLARAEGVPRLTPAQPEVRAPSTRRIDVSRFQPKQITVDIPGVGQVSAGDAVKLIGEEGMRRLLLEGSGARIRVPGLGWMSLPEAARVIGPEGVRNILGIEPAASPQRAKATEAFNAWLDDHPGDLTGAYNRAIRIDPSYPAPATLPARPEALSPQQQVWQTFFSRGWDALNEAQRQYITKQLQQDDELSTALRVVTTYGGLAAPGAAEQTLLDNANAIIAQRLGIPLEDVEQPAPGFLDRLKFLLSGQLPGGGPKPVDARTWATRQLANFRATGRNILGRDPQTKQDFRRLFNRARRDPRYNAIPKNYWRVLLTLVEQLPETGATRGR